MTAKKRKTQLGGIFIFLLIWVSTMLNTGKVFAAPLANPSGPDRYTAITINYTSYEWWLLEWEDSELVCKLKTEHEGLPTLGEVYVDCGEDLYTAWVEQDACPDEIFREDTAQCPGYYMHLNDSEEKEREIAVALPAPVIWIDLEECVAEEGTNRCERAPMLVLRGDEPLPGEKITRITGELGGEPFTCDSAFCELPLSETDEDGIDLTFWASSSYGDSSQLFNAHLRVILAKKSGDKEETEKDQDEFWYVDVLSSQWRGEANASCAKTWDAFPPVGGVPFWLSTPEDISKLESEISYTYLAGNLISQGVVDASQCLDFGLDANGLATTCGIEAAQPAMNEWQNRFDPVIIKAAEESSIPAVLLKRLFARESQFWPSTFNEGSDVGFGHLTENGADIALLWNASFFEEYCPLVLEDEECQDGYLGLDEAKQERLRGALVYSVNATCEECPVGLDLTQADFSVGVFAHTLLGSCEQTGRVVYNNTDQAPGEKTSYEDLWKFTLVDYNAGAGCLSLAIGKTLDASQELDWGNLSANLTTVCMGAKDYVEDISE